MTAIAQWSITSSKRSSLSGLVITGTVSYITAFICMADILVSPWGFPGRCGNGFSGGNCFLADGLNQMMYPVIIPLLIIIGTSVFMINKFKKNNK